jgi:UDP:flavonoid glycosyltransferase YjiC (YdhE family)
MIALELVKRGVKVQFSTYGQAADYLSSRGHDCLNSSALQLGWDDSGFSLRRTLRGLAGEPTIFVKQLGEELGRIGKFRPQMIISDSRITPLMASRLLAIPSAVILNQIRILLGPRGPRWLENTEAMIMRQLWGAADLIAVPDLPPPWTISEANFKAIEIAASKLHYIGFIMPNNQDGTAEPEWLSNNRKGKLIYAQISGPELTKRSLEGVLIEGLTPLTKENTVVVSWGRNGGSGRPENREGLIWFDWCPDKDWLIRESDMLIVRAGHSTLSQAVRLAKPLVVLPIPMQTEQGANASKMERLGVAIVLDQRDMSPVKIRSAVEKILTDEKYRKNALQLAEHAKQYSGVSAFLELIWKHLA